MWPISFRAAGWAEGIVVRPYAVLQEIGKQQGGREEQRDRAAGVWQAPV